MSTGQEDGRGGPKEELSCPSCSYTFFLRWKFSRWKIEEGHVTAESKVGARQKRIEIRHVGPQWGDGE